MGYNYFTPFGGWIIGVPDTLPIPSVSFRTVGPRKLMKINFSRSEVWTEWTWWTEWTP
jgi:hypothetical protein